LRRRSPPSIALAVSSVFASFVIHTPLHIPVQSSDSWTSSRSCCFDTVLNLQASSRPTKLPLPDLPGSEREGAPH
jgi:hypothetical protein